MKKALFVFSLLFISLLVSNKAHAANVGGDMSGWLDSPNIGWVSLNCLDLEALGGEYVDICSRTGDYKVSVSSTGAITGWAWSDAVGWIKFGGLNTADMPSGGGTTKGNATINLGNGKITGWIKAVGMSASDGADGWISLSGTMNPSPDPSPSPTSNGGWTMATTSTSANFTGVAWGSDVIGWLHVSASCADCRFGDPVEPPEPVVTVECGLDGDPVENEGDHSKTFTFKATASGGTTPYEYIWSGIGDGSDTDTISVTLSPGESLAEGEVYVYAGDSDGNWSDNASCPAISVEPVTGGQVSLFISSNSNSLDDLDMYSTGFTNTTVKKGGKFSMRFIHDLLGYYECIGYVSKGGLSIDATQWPEIDAWWVQTLDQGSGRSQIKDLYNNPVPNTPEFAKGKYTFRVTCSDTRPHPTDPDITDEVYLNVVSAVEGEI
jgi:hypothetical protein